MTSDLRTVARRCVGAALRAVDPERLVRVALEERDLAGPVSVIAVGKAALGMAAGAYEVLGERLVSGVVVVPHDGSGAEAPSGFELFRAGHPVPDEASAVAASRVRGMAECSPTGGVLLVLLSGGASALMAEPAGQLTLTDLEKTTRLLLESGASIEEINTVRKHVDTMKGGRLVRWTQASRIIGLVLSDVVGDRLDVIASGPLTPDQSTFGDAIEVLRHHGVWARIPAPVRSHLSEGEAGRHEESPVAKDPIFRGVECSIVGSNRTAQYAAIAAAIENGFETRPLGEPLVGEAREMGKYLAGLAKVMHASRTAADTRRCVVAGGETTVRVTGTGQGGRNQEVALGAALELEGLDGVLIAAIGTDGKDGPTDAAGAWVDGRTAGRARKLGLDAIGALENNDVYPFFETLGDLVITGPTGTNVADLALVLVE